MSLKHLTIGAVVVVCTFVAQAAAQKNEVSGSLGRTLTSNQSIEGAPAYDPDLRHGNGLTFEVNYARRVMTFGHGLLSLTPELPFVVDLRENLHAAQDVVPKSYASYFLTPAARLSAFPDEPVSPWVSLGGGFGHFNPSSMLEFGNHPNPSPAGTSTGVLQGGIGLDVKIWHGFSLRGEGRDFWSGVPQLNVNTGKSRQNNIFAGGGIVWHF
jgi:hypothetical protein